MRCVGHFSGIVYGVSFQQNGFTKKGGTKEGLASADGSGYHAGLPESQRKVDTGDAEQALMFSLLTFLFPGEGRLVELNDLFVLPGCVA